MGECTIGFAHSSDGTTGIVSFGYTCENYKQRYFEIGFTSETFRVYAVQTKYANNSATATDWKVNANFMRWGSQYASSGTTKKLPMYIISLMEQLGH